MACGAPATLAFWVAAPALRAQERSRKRRRRPTRRERALARQIGFATFYSRQLHGEETASGVPYDQHALTAAHRKWPFGTRVRVTHLDSGRSVVVTITDRGPYGAAPRKRAIIDLSRAAARRLQMIEEGRTRVRLEVLRWGVDEETSAPRL